MRLDILIHGFITLYHCHHHYDHHCHYHYHTISNLHITGIRATNHTLNSTKPHLRCLTIQKHKHKTINSLQTQPAHHFYSFVVVEWYWYIQHTNKRKTNHQQKTTRHKYSYGFITIYIYIYIY